MWLYSVNFSSSAYKTAIIVKGMFKISGHFAQMIWKNSQELGMGLARSKNGRVIVVANYNPRGNYIGQFAENVPRPR